MAELLLCPICSAWRPHAQDAWCGQCSAPVARLSVRVQPDVLQINNIAPTLFVELANSSCADLDVEALETSGWITLEKVPARLAAGETVRLTGKARTMAVRQPEAGTLTLRTVAGQAEAMVLAIEEAPAFAVTPSPLEVWTGPGGTRKRFLLQVAPVRSTLRMRQVRGGPLGGLKVFEGLQDTVLSSPGEGPEVTVQCDAVHTQAGSSAASLLVQFDGPHGPTEAEVWIELVQRKAPEVRWQGNTNLRSSATTPPVSGLTSCSATSPRMGLMAVRKTPLLWSKM